MDDHWNDPGEKNVTSLCRIGVVIIDIPYSITQMCHVRAKKVGNVIEAIKQHALSFQETKWSVLTIIDAMIILVYQRAGLKQQAA